MVEGYFSCMEIIRSVKEMQTASSTVKRSGRRVALVPTMGALHEGHVALMRKARDHGAHLFGREAIEEEVRCD